MKPYRNLIRSFSSVSSLIVTLALVLSLISPQPAFAQNGDGIHRQLNAQSGRVSFMAPENGRAIAGGNALGILFRPQDPAMGLAKRFGPEFGLRNPERDLSLIKSHMGDDGHLMARYQQNYQGIPVIGGELIVNTNENGDLYSMNGEVSPDLSLSTQPVIDSEQSRQTALKLLAKWYKKLPSDFVSTDPELWIFDESLLQPSTRPAELVWRMEVTAKEKSIPVRELVLVNAQTGVITFYFNQIDTAWAPTPVGSRNAAQDIKPTATPLPTDTPLIPTEAPMINEQPVVAATPSIDGITADSSLQDLPETIAATTWYVATTGNNSNSCSSAGSPCATINGAIGKAAASGDTIKVASGTYTGAGTIALINKSLTLSGGWNAAFSTQTGYATIDGGNTQIGIEIDTPNLTVVLSKFVVQNANTGVYLTASNLNVQISETIIQTSAVGIYDNNSGGTLNLNRVALIKNTGNGIYNSTGNVNFTNSTISGNHASSAGSAISNVNGNINIQYTTITNNSGYYDSAIWSLNGGAQIQIGNSILAGNSYWDCQANMTSTGYNIFGSSPPCQGAITTQPSDQIGANPQLGTLLPGGYHPLLSGSPAIGAANLATCPSTDQRGVARPQNGTCDIGAYESTLPGAVSSLAILDGNNQRAAPTFAYAKPLKVIALDNQGTPVPSVSVTFTAPSSGASGTFANTGTRITTVVTDSNGIATTSVFTANNQSGAFAVAASASGVGSINFNLENASTLYVSPSGNNSNSCSVPASPCLTINGAIGKAATEDAIKVAVGTYNEQVLINKNLILSGGWNATFTTQNDRSMVDGQGIRKGIVLDPVTVIIDQFIVQNGTDSAGGGIDNSGTLTINDSIIQANTNTSYGSSGGGIKNQGTLVLNNSIVRNNTGTAGAGINNQGTLTLNNSTVSGNSSTGAWGTGGGGIYNNGSLTINNSTISGNSASASSGMGSGGGIYSYGGNVLLNNSTVTGNIGTGSSGGYGGGILAGSTVTIKNSIIALNAAATDGPDCSSTVSSAGYNLIGNNSGCVFGSATGDLVGTNASPINPRLTPLQDNGGPTFTHALMSGSLAINAGNTVTPGTGGNACLGTDQRGTIRPVGGRCDIGAFEGSVPYVPTPYASTYTANLSSSLPGSLLCTEVQPNCTNGSNLHADAAHKYAIGVFNFYLAKYGRDSIDNNGMTIRSTVQYCDPDFPCPYDNAYWSGTQMVYGSAHDFSFADDIVAHELTHGVTDYESNLFYYYQSGAINESISDVFGEYYDQVGNVTAGDTAGVKWLLGEDVSGLGAIRSMSNPPTYGDPDKMTSPNYFKAADDNGGIHENSGVNNKAVFLMVEGGSFNGITVTSIGWEKTAAIYYEANTNLLTSGADYSDLYNAVQQACTNLIGQKGITLENCTQVKNSLDAVEMNTRQPLGDFEDPSFEQSYNVYPYWDQFSTNFGSPLCTVTDCGDSNGTAGPRTGLVWGWLGGTTNNEVTSLSQTVYFPNGYPSLKLNFYLWIGRATPGSDANDVFTARVDGVIVFSANATQKNSYPVYTPVTVDVSAFANNDLHTIEFSSVTSGQIVNFNLDDVSLGDDSFTISGNAGTGGVLLSYFHRSLKTVTADASGNYSINVPRGWSGTVTPTKPGYIFSPASLNYVNVTSNQTLQNYTAIPIYFISGNAGVGGVTLNYTDGTPKTVTSQANGNYSLPVLNHWNGMVTPSHPCYTFNPINRPYSNVTSNQTNQNYAVTLNPASGCADINVLIGGANQGRYGLPDGASTREIYTNIDNGPVKIISSNAIPLIASQRINLKTSPNYSSYSEFMGLPAGKLTDTYIFPWYNNATAGGLSSQIRFGNVGGAPTDVTIKIGTTSYGPYHLEANQSDRRTFDNVDAGPVEVKSSDGVPIIASMRINLKKLPTYSSYTEFLGLSASSTVGTKYMFPWYNNATAGGLDSQLRFGNVGNATTVVSIKIAGVTQPQTYTLGPSESARVTLTNIDNGPVEVFSSDGVPIIASQRINLKSMPTYSSYAEFMGLPGATLSETRYLFPWYNNATAGGVQSQIRFGNVGVATTVVSIKIAGVTQPQTYTLAPNESARVTLDNVDAGPVEVFSNGQPIIAAMRVNLKPNALYSSYSEFMGLSVGNGMPGNELSTTYWFPWYNNATAGGLSSQLRFGVP